MNHRKKLTWILVVPLLLLGSANTLVAFSFHTDPLSFFPMVCPNDNEEIKFRVYFLTRKKYSIEIYGTNVPNIVPPVSMLYYSRNYDFYNGFWHRNISAGGLYTPPKNVGCYVIKCLYDSPNHIAWQRSEHNMYNQRDLITFDMDIQRREWEWDIKVYVYADVPR